MAARLTAAAPASSPASVVVTRRGAGSRGVNDEEDGVRGGWKRFALLMVAELVIAERERSCWTREEDGFVVLVLLLRFPWLLREEEELAARDAEMVVVPREMQR